MRGGSLASVSRASDRKDSKPRYRRRLLYCVISELRQLETRRSAASRYPASLKGSYREKLAVADWHETSGELSVGTDQRHERRHLFPM
jgi:hypothetical protein